jgi:nitrate/nitrite transporter NarK
MFGIAFYGCSFVLSMGPLPMIVTSEIFSNEQRGLCAGIAMSANWACNLLVTFLFPVIYDALPQWVPFICFAAACLICLVVVWLFLPETKGVALEDMQELLRRRVVQVPALQKVGKREFDSYHSISQSNGERPGLLND